jgi:acetolactate synthase-1/2/3 large subunit
MIPRRARGTLTCLNKARHFSTTAPVAVITPHSKVAQGSNSKQTTNTSKRTQSTSTAAATKDRPLPSPAFNRDDTRWNDVQPLRPYRAPEMDHSFVGMKGGEIFHEMMLRHDVKHICESRDLESHWLEY